MCWPSRTADTHIQILKLQMCFNPLLGPKLVTASLDIYSKYRFLFSRRSNAKLTPTGGRMSGVWGFAVIHILFVILLSGPAPLGIASLLVAVEKTQTELEGLDIVDGAAGEEGVWDALPRPPDPVEAAERMHGFVIASDCKKTKQQKQRVGSTSYI